MTPNIKGMLRAQAWERAKGELRSILVTYEGERDKHLQMKALVEDFVREVEDRGLAE